MEQPESNVVADGNFDGPEPIEPPNSRCGYCDYPYACMSPGPACLFARKQAGMDQPTAPAAEPIPEGVWVRYYTRTGGANPSTVIVAFYKDELSALRDAVGQGHKVKLLQWGQEL